MAQEGNEDGSQSGFVLQEAGTMPPCTNKRGRDVHEEDAQATALDMGVGSEIARDLNLSGDVISSYGGGNGSEGPVSPLNNLTLSQSEKRTKCGHFDLASNIQYPSPRRPTANVDVVITDDGNNVGAGMASQQVRTDAIAKVPVKVADEGMQSGITSSTQFVCEICSVISTSAKDLEIHLAGRRHAKAMKQGSGVENSRAKKICRRGSEAEVSTPQEIQVLAENGSTHFNPNMDTASIEHHVSLEASKGHIPGCTVLNSMDEENDQAILSKCCDSKDANTVAALHRTSTDGPCTEAFVFGSDPSGKAAVNHGQQNRCQPGANGISRDSTLADGLTEKICSRMTSEGEPHKYLLASVRSSSNSDCVAQALAAVSSMRGCPGLEEVPQGSCCDQGAECSDSYFQGTKRGDSNGMVTMHTQCFSNLLHEVRVSTIEDALWYVGLKANSWLPNASSVLASSPQGEDLHCTVCRVKYGSKADLDLHLAGRRHASVVQRMSSRCQLCNINCNSERDFQLHLSGKKHVSKLRLVQKRVTF